MRKITFLLIILLIVVIFSVAINYERFTNTVKFKLKFEKVEEQNDNFPSEKNKSDFSIQYKNQTKHKIKVWLDDQPFCLPVLHSEHINENSGFPVIRGLDEGKCMQGGESNPADWKGIFGKILKYCKDNENGKGNNNVSMENGRYVIKLDSGDIIKPLPEFSILKEKKGQTNKWEETKINITNDENESGEKTKITEELRSQILEPGEVWRIQPPTIIRKESSKEEPYMCFDQYCNPDEINDNVFQSKYESEPWGGRCIPFCESEYCKDAKNKERCKKCYPKGKSISSDNGIRRNCPGTGSWITRENANMKAVDGTTKIEYNNNNNQLWFDVSSVDGINTNISTQYVSGGDEKIPCPQEVKEGFKNSINIDNTKCNIKLIDEEGKPTCPYFTFKNDVPTCPSLKDWPKTTHGNYVKKVTMNYDTNNLKVTKDYQDNCNDILNNKAFQEVLINQLKNSYPEKYPEKLSDIKIEEVYKDLAKIFHGKDTTLEKPTQVAIAGCQPADPTAKTLCHLWWSNPANKCAKEWLDYIQEVKEENSFKKECQQYAWAYDEMRFGLSKDGEQVFWTKDGKEKESPQYDFKFDENGNPKRKLKSETIYENSENNIKPLLRCDINKGAFNVAIKEIIDIQPESKSDNEKRNKQEFIQELKRNYRYRMKDESCDGLNGTVCNSKINQDKGCIYDGKKCFKKGTLCGTVIKNSKTNELQSLNCYVYSGINEGTCDATSKEKCNDSDINSQKIWLGDDIDLNYDTKIKTMIEQKFKDSGVDNKFRCFKPTTYLTDKNYTSDDKNITGYGIGDNDTRIRNWTVDEEDNCLFPSYYVPN